MKELTKLRKFNELKNVYRANSVGDRKESAAEHSWSCLVLADYFLNLTKLKINRLKVYELLIYHDVVEIGTGDVNIKDIEKHKAKEKIEKKTMIKLKEHFPEILKEKVFDLFIEYKEGKTIEGRFAKAIDALDSTTQEIDYKKDWKGWTEEFLRYAKGHLFEEFPELKKTFEKTLNFLRKERYFEQ